jgi:hypothetical protein
MLILTLTLKEQYLIRLRKHDLNVGFNPIGEDGDYVAANWGSSYGYPSSMQNFVKRQLNIESDKGEYTGQGYDPKTVQQMRRGKTFVIHISHTLPKADDFETHMNQADEWHQKILSVANQTAAGTHKITKDINDFINIWGPNEDNQ